MIQGEHSLRRLRKKRGKGRRRKKRERTCAAPREKRRSRAKRNRKREDGVKLKVQVGRSFINSEGCRAVRCWNLPTLKLRFGGKVSLKLKDDHLSRIHIFSRFVFLSSMSSFARFLRDFCFSSKTFFKWEHFINGVIIFLLESLFLLDCRNFFFG